MWDRFTKPYHSWSEVPPDARDIWWGEFRTGGSISFAKHQFKKRFSKSNHLAELHKHQKVDKKGQYMDFMSEVLDLPLLEFSEKRSHRHPLFSFLFWHQGFLVQGPGGGLRRGQLYGAGSEAAHSEPRVVELELDP
ncbi:hypothetical protein M9H77_16643 [Catharanthus roseus]|uniref:Uncharacterized protein n=1 Tax=Catharanthus roseus TaxID=4058 RepID=A0ACC0B2C0_CATRO|nr:hypothetical protein M9H77_16643 [Catharanthus roseus]